jgi:hypothetical protein
MNESKSFDPNRTSKDLLRDLQEALRGHQHSVDLHRGRITAETEEVVRRIDAVTGLVSQCVQTLHVLAPQVQEHEDTMKLLDARIGKFDAMEHRFDGAFKLLRWVAALVVGLPSFAAGMAYLLGAFR